MTNEQVATAARVACRDDAPMESVAGRASAEGRDLDPDIRRFIREVGEAVARYPEFGTAPYPQVRRWAEEVRAPWCRGGPQMLQTWSTAASTRHGEVRVRIHKPCEGTLPALIYLHGGGWTLFSIDTHDRVMREYAARARCAVVGIDYALAPEARFPVALEQIVDTVAWLGSRGGEFAIDASRLAIGGDSAGANLSVATCLSLRDAGHQLLRAMLLNYGAFTTECSAEACRRYGGPQYMLGCEEMAVYWANYMRGPADSRNPLVCPLLARLEGLPPAFLAVAECDILGEQSLRLSSACWRRVWRHAARSIAAPRTALSKPCPSPPSAIGRWQRPPPGWLRRCNRGANARSRVGR
ncbi:MAG: alpha/beta hydrolase fold domain-containing protein [Gammaproteobacteria bacterium]|nr:alpha/beta hydrolase fold domain-containing protein [Gammaproteobacteria bacterium]